MHHFEGPNGTLFVYGEDGIGTAHVQSPHPQGGNARIDVPSSDLLAFADHVRAQRGDEAKPSVHWGPMKAIGRIDAEGRFTPIARDDNPDREKREFIRRCVMEVFGTMSMEDEVSHGFMEQTITNAKRFWAQLRERGL